MPVKFLTQSALKVPVPVHILVPISAPALPLTVLMLASASQLWTRIQYTNFNSFFYKSKYNGFTSFHMVFLNDFLKLINE